MMLHLLLLCLLAFIGIANAEPISPVQLLELLHNAKMKPALSSTTTFTAPPDSTSRSTTTAASTSQTPAYNLSMSWQAEHTRLQSLVSDLQTKRKQSSSSYESSRCILTTSISNFNTAVERGFHGSASYDPAWTYTANSQPDTEWSRREYEMLNRTSEDMRVGKYDLQGENKVLQGWNLKEMLELRSGLVWKGCGLAKGTSGEEWAAYEKAMAETTPKETQAKVKMKKCPRPKFPVWAGVLVGIVVGRILAGITFICDNDRRARKEEGERASGDDDASVRTQESAETGSLPPYEEVER